MRDYKETSGLLRGLAVSLQVIDSDYAQLCDDAADAIEELLGERDKALKRLCEWCGVCSEENQKALECDDIAMLAKDTNVPDKIVHCGECRFWDSPPSCEGLAKCVTGESGIRYRSKNDFCSKGMPLPQPPEVSTDE